MKTRQELILDFMLALVSGLYVGRPTGISAFVIDSLYTDAANLADKYLENV